MKMSSTPTRRRTLIPGSHFAAYAAAGAAAAFSGSQSAEGAITYTSVGIFVRDTTLNGAGLGLDLLFDTFHLGLVHNIGTSNAANGFAQAIPDAFVAAGVPTVQVGGLNTPPSAFDYVTRLNAGDAISSIAFLAPGVYGTMAFNSGFTSSQFLAAGPQFMGVKFDTDRYGWVRVNMTGAPLNAFTIEDYAYAGHGEPLKAGEMPIPEPTPLGLLALGATGLSAWRRRRQSAA